MNEIRLSRRDFARAGAGVAAGLSLGGFASLARAHEVTDLITKPIPSTGERLPVIGLGTNQYSVNTSEAMAPFGKMCWKRWPKRAAS